MGSEGVDTGMNPPLTISLARPDVEGFIYCEDFEWRGGEDVREAAFIDKLFINLE
jgi:hypothetical protein